MFESALIQFYERFRQYIILLYIPLMATFAGVELGIFPRYSLLFLVPVFGALLAGNMAKARRSWRC